MKKKTLIIIISVVLAALAAVGIVIALSSRNDPRTPEESSTESIDITVEPETGAVEPGTETDTEPVGTENHSESTTVTDTSEPETEPLETEPAETEPAETEPNDTEPIETSSDETDPVESVPAETGSDETRSVETEPIVQPCSHSYVESIVLNATCSSTGTKKLVCSKCGDTKTETIAKLGHSFGSYETTTAATCTAAGVKTRTCSRCGATETQSIPALGHSFSNYVVTVEASCSSAGQSTSTCARCGATVTETIPKYDHSYIETTITPATCIADGVVSVDCQHCGHHLDNHTLTGGNHAFEAVVTQEPTATETGTVVYTCSICGETVTSTLPSVGTHRCCPEEEDYAPGKTGFRFHSKSRYLYSYVYIDCTGNYKDYSYEVWHCDKCGYDYKRPYSQQYVPLPPKPQHNWVLTDHADNVLIYENGYHIADETYQVINGTYQFVEPWELRYDTCSIDEYTCSSCGKHYHIVSGSNGVTKQVGGGALQSVMDGVSCLWDGNENAPALAWKSSSWTPYETIREGNGVDTGKIEKRTCLESGDVWYRFTTIDGGFTWEGNDTCSMVFDGMMHWYRVSDTYMGNCCIMMFDYRTNITLDMIPSVKIDNCKGVDSPATVFWKDKNGEMNSFTWCWYDENVRNGVYASYSLKFYDGRTTTSRNEGEYLGRAPDGNDITWS